MSNEKSGGGGEERRVLDVKARTVDEAVARGLVRLGGLSRSEVKIEVLGEGRSGLLGFGAEEATVRLTVLRPGESAADIPASAPPPSREEPAEPAEAPPPSAAVEPAPGIPGTRADMGPSTADIGDASATAASPAPQAPRAAAKPAPAAPGAAHSDPTTAGADPTRLPAAAGEVTLTMLRLLGFEDATVEPSDALLPSDVEDGDSLVLCIRGQGTERLLANDAEALNALQFLVRLVVSRRLEGWVSVLLDVDGDRARRVQELLQLATQSASLVEREGRPVALPPMTAYERRVVHLALRDHDRVATQSIGSGQNRKVTVRLKDQLLPIG